MNYTIYVDILSRIISKHNLSKFPNTQEGLKNFKKEFEDIKKEIKKKFEIEFNNDNLDPKQAINDIKARKEATNACPDTPFDDDFGKYHSDLGKEKKKAEKDLLEIMLNDAYKRSMLVIKAPKFEGRPSLIISLGPNNLEDFESYCDILGKDNNDIDPFSGKKYGEIKSKMLAEGIDNCIQIGKELFKKNKNDAHEYYKSFFSAIAGLFEFDGTKIKDTLKRGGFNIDDFKTIREKYESIKDIKNPMSSCTYFADLIPRKTNPLYPYGKEEDFEFMAKLYDSYLDPDYPLEKFENKKTSTNILMAMSTSAASYDNSKVIKENLTNGMSSSVFVDRFKVYLSPALNVKLEDISFFNGNEEIKMDDPNVKDAESIFLTKVGDLVTKGEKITLRDKSGKFLLNYKTDSKNLMNNIGGGNSMDINKVFDEAYTKALSKVKVEAGKTDDLDENKKVLMDNIKEASKTMVENIDKDIEKEIDNKVKKMYNLLDKFGPEKERELDKSFYYGIKDMFSDILGKKDKNDKAMSFNTDKDAYIVGLKSIKTFCQGYLDEKDGFELDQKEQAKYDAINSIYIDLMDVENELTYVKSVEEKMEEKLQLKARKDNPEFIKAMEEKLKLEKANDIQNENVEKIQVFDEDPTINNDNKQVSEQVKDDLNQVKEKNLENKK